MISVKPFVSQSPMTNDKFSTDHNMHLITIKVHKLTDALTHLRNPRLELIWLLAIRLHYFGAGTEHGLCLCGYKYSHVSYIHIYILLKQKHMQPGVLQ